MALVSMPRLLTYGCTLLCTHTQGQFLGGEMVGSGILTFAKIGTGAGAGRSARSDGAFMYDGEFLSNKPHGTGMLAYTTGRRQP